MNRIIVSLFFIVGTVSVSYCQSKTYKTTLKTMMEVAGTEATFKAAISQIMTMFKQQKPNVPAEVWSDVEKEFNRDALANLVEMLTPVYEKHLTESELNDMIAFYKTPTGKKFAQKTPFIMQESMQVGQEWGMKIGQELAEKMKAKGY